MKLYLFDMGSKIYGDCILAVEGERTILIDGAHTGDWEASATTTSIPEQLAKVLGEPPFRIDLLVVTHCHSDHIGCLPRMVEDGTVEFEWALVADEKLGFPNDGEDAAMDSEMAKVVAAMSEEPQPDLVGKALDVFLTDAVKLPEKYKTMLAKLKRDGTTIVRYTGPTARVKQVEKEFSDFGLKVLGPTHQHLIACRDQLAGVKKKVRRAVDGLRRADAGLDAAQMYRTILSTGVSAASSSMDDLRASLDMAGPGAALNDQSIVLSLGVAGEKVLLTGDMQLAKPEVPGLAADMQALLAEIKSGGPYQFVKLPHHGSYNGFNDEVLAAFEDTPAFGISTGRGDPKHPDSGVLELLEKIGDKHHWARTDRNGRVAVSFKDGRLEISVLDGDLDDASPNSEDTMPIGAPEEIPSAPAPPKKASAETFIEPKPEPIFRRAASGEVEITARIPHQRTKVTITIDIEPELTSWGGDAPDFPDPKKKLLAGGRPIPPLAFVTDARRLAGNIGRTEAEEVLTRIRTAGQLVVDLDGQTAPFETLRNAAARYPSGIKGVVIVGGYDVVPSERFDTLPPTLRRSIGPTSRNDPDDFIVWSDQTYGDLDGDLLADVPVSRIPDGHTAKLVDVALNGCSDGSKSVRFGLRNHARPFADDVFAGLPGSESMHTSEATISADIARERVAAKLIYLMLHGSDSDGSRFWGETQGGMLEAMTVNNVPDPCGAVIFAGCCWGALTVRTRANISHPGDPVQVLTPAQSIALSFLQSGAAGFVGCTGAHYSPVEDEMNFFGAPMHSAFWKHILAGKRPAEALFLAKIDYIQEMPHGRTKIEEIAIENKILRQFTCLGLGW